MRLKIIIHANMEGLIFKVTVTISYAPSEVSTGKFIAKW